ncbi:AcrR family transcriptional regulator [Leucobacter exalbidus]|uniref:AcrR family transcriptional regulator n=1 Tax=Leucobacter exalbidus TaxID=662960 RepID=A0A940PV24_9MICO|nr:TetR/AcrR family transcriptional regulator [Leucobacter exalbidus]MBP1327522.1 AcrR family transcriptional regulator [Leucobacter exalbidus]
MRDSHELLAAAASEMAEHGYSAASLSAIAARLGLTKGALVRQFPTKEHFARGIITALRLSITGEQERATAAYPRSGARALIRFLIVIRERAKERPEVRAGIVLFSDRSAPSSEIAELGESWRGALQAMLEAAQRDGEIDPEVSPREIAEFLLMLNMGEGIVTTRWQAPESAGVSLGALRRSLRNIGIADVDALIEEVQAGLR